MHIKYSALILSYIATLTTVYNSHALTFTITNKSTHNILNARVYPDGNCDPVMINPDNLPLQPQQSFSKSSECAQAFKPTFDITWFNETTLPYSITTDIDRPDAGPSLEIEIFDTPDLTNQYVQVTYFDKFKTQRRERFSANGTKINY